MIKQVIVDVKRSFEGPVVFLGCEQKMVRQDKKNAASPMVPDPGKWSVALMVKVRTDDNKTARENITVTLESPSKPCNGLEEFDKVELVDLQYNMMATEQGKAMAFWRVKEVRKLSEASRVNGVAAQTSLANNT
jgi:hypothetical protein